jgi:hypothetical protein
VQYLHFTKEALDDAISKAQKGGGDVRGLMDTKSKLLGLLESKDFAPTYQAARQSYADLSKPINQMDVGQELLDKYQSALADYGASQRVTAAKYADALRHGDATAQRALGFPGARLENVLGTTQANNAEMVAFDLARKARADELGRAVGSPTGQNLVSQDLLGSILGPLGIPSQATSNAALQTLMRPVSFLSKIPEQNVLKQLGVAMADPEAAKAALLAARRNGPMLRKLDEVTPYLPLGFAPLAIDWRQ